jgi:predicted Zn-dependent protease with MMP-like domain
MDARVGRADPPWASHLPAEAVVRSLSRAHRLRLLPQARRQGGAAREEIQEDRPEEVVTRESFRKLVDEALAGIPAEFRDALKNIVIVVEDEPTDAQLEEVGIVPPDTLLGLYEGIPLTERHWSHEAVMPDKVTLFQGPIEDSSDDEDEIVVAIGETLIHEIGHYFGLSEEEIEEIEERYWRGESDDEDGNDDGNRED